MATPEDPTSSKESRELRRVFTKIHDVSAWGDCESLSGPGSSRDRAASFLPSLLEVIAKLRVNTLLDAPCGDFNWAQPLADSVESYLGVDVVPDLIQTNSRDHASPTRQFLCLDMVHDPLPSADLIFCRDGLVHLSTRNILTTLKNFQRTGAEYLMTTTFVGPRANEEIVDGHWRPLNLQSPPFSLPDPIGLVDEQCLHSGAGYADKRLGVWRLQDLRL